MKIDQVKALRLSGKNALGEHQTFVVRADNRGDPYEEGVTLELNNERIYRSQHYDEWTGVGIFLDLGEERQLREWLNARHEARKR